MLDVLIFVPANAPHAQHWITICTSYSLRHGYQPVSVVRRWHDVIRLVLAGMRPVVVAGKREHIPVDRLPRLEIVTEEYTQEAKSEHRRPTRRSEDRR